MLKFILSLFTVFPLFAVQLEELRTHFPQDQVWQGASADEDVMVCCHGLGMDQTIGAFVQDTGIVKQHLLAFNFPDFGEEIDISRPDLLSFGTVRELAPVIERLNILVNDLGIKSVHLYGFSAGGGAVVNVLSVLKAHRFQKELGLSPAEMDQIFAAVERGTVILDCPLKSIDEIIDVAEPDNHYLKIVAKTYADNDLRPIDSLEKLDGAKLNILLVFMTPDDVLSNRDDALFITRLERANQLGRTVIVRGREGLHIPAMPSLCEGYLRLINRETIK